MGARAKYSPTASHLAALARGVYAIKARRRHRGGAARSGTHPRGSTRSRAPTGAGARGRLGSTGARAAPWEKCARRWTSRPTARAASERVVLELVASSSPTVNGALRGSPPQPGAANENSPPLPAVECFGRARLGIGEATLRTDGSAEVKRRERGGARRAVAPRRDVTRVFASSATEGAPAPAPSLTRAALAHSPLHDGRLRWRPLSALSLHPCRRADGAR